MDIFKTLILDTPDTLSNISGILPVSNGGTGADNAPDARVNLLPSYTGNANKVLSLNGGATDVEWTSNGAGDVVGPASATDNAVVRYDGTTGKLVQNSGVAIDDSGNVNLADNSSLNWSTAPGRPYIVGNKASDLIKLGTPTGGDLLNLVGAKVGIGTVAPGRALTVAATEAVASLMEGTSASGTFIDLTNTNYHSGDVARLGLDSSGHMQVAAPGTGGDLLLKTASTARIAILNGGNVGIGTASPTEKLTVSGSVSATSTANNAGQVALLLQNADGNAGIGSRLAWRLDNLANEWGYINVNRVGGGATAQMDFAVNGAAYSGAASTVMSLDSTGLDVTGAITNTTYFVGGGGGANPGGLGGSKYVMDWFSGSHRSFSYGADASTNGAWAWNSQRSDGSNAVAVMSLDSTGLAVDGSIQVNSWIGGNSSTGQLSLYGDREATQGVTILDSGNVGIGTTAPGFKLDVVGDIRSNPASGNAVYRYSRASANKFATYVDGSDNYIFFSDAATAERMRITSSGNVGIGTSSPGSLLTLSADAAHEIQLNRTGANPGVCKIENSGNLLVLSNDVSGISFKTGSTPATRMTINAGGDVFMHGTTINGTENDAGYSAGGLSFRVSRDTTANANQIVFYNPNGAIGTIQTNGSATAYNTSSDYRLKENVVPMQDALQRITQLKPSRFNFIADDSVVVDGFLAHEVQEHVPEAISGEKDAMKDEEYEVTPAVLDDDGNEITPAVMDTRSVPDYQGIDQSKLVPLLVGAIQELTARIAALENN